MRSRSRGKYPNTSSSNARAVDPGAAEHPQAESPAREIRQHAALFRNPRDPAARDRVRSSAVMSSPRRRT